MLAMAPGTAKAAECSAVSQFLDNYIFSVYALKVLGVGTISVGVLIVVGAFFGSIIASLKSVLEVLGYVACAALIAGASKIAPDYQLWPLMVGCFLFLACWTYTTATRFKDSDDPTFFFGLLTAVWGGTAIAYNDTAIGFITIGALMGLLGFSFVVTPFCYSFGFRGAKGYDEDYVIKRATAAAMVLVIAAVVLKRIYPQAPAAITVFAPGMQWLATFVMALGLLIMSNRWFYYKEIQICDGLPAAYWTMQVVGIGALLMTMFAGLLFGMQAMANIAGTMLVFLLAAKPIEVPKHSVSGFGFAIICSGLILSGAWYYANQAEAFARALLGV